MPHWAPQQLESLPSAPSVPSSHTHVDHAGKSGGLVALWPAPRGSRFQASETTPRVAQESSPGTMCWRMTNSHPNPAGVGRAHRRHCLVLEHKGTFGFCWKLVVIKHPRACRQPSQGGESTPALGSAEPRRGVCWGPRGPGCFPRQPLPAPSLRALGPLPTQGGTVEPRLVSVVLGSFLP